MQILTDKDRENIIRLLQADKPLPEIYKSRLFPAEDKEYIELTKIYQLVYQGKKRKEDIIAETLEAPLQEVRTFNSENAFPDSWRNMLIFGDNLLALKTLYEDQRGPNKYGTRNKIKLIYIDPPFSTKQDFMKDREKAYRDKIIGAQFIEFLRKRLIFLREVLADDGSIYVHCDAKKSHYIKAICDEVFQENAFLCQVIWKRIQSGRKAKATKWHSVDDLLLMYEKQNHEFRPQYLGYSKKYISRFTEIDENGKYFWDNIGSYSQERLELLESQGRVRYSEKGAKPRIKNYLHEGKGVIVDNIWTDIPPINSQAEEDTHYPTQKPEQLLERIINASSNGNDIVLDAFGGSGTTLSVAEKLGRRWIGMDCGKLAIYTIQKRMLNLTTQIGSVKKDERKLTERVDDFDNHLKSSKAFFIINEKAAKGELMITDAFLETLHTLVSLTQKGGEFTLVCPEEKFKVRSYEEDEDGRRIVIKDQISYVISFVEPKEKAEREKPLTAKTFTLFNAGRNQVVSSI